MFQINVQARTGKHKRAKAHTWNADSGATVSVTNDISLFQTITDFAPSQRVCVANKQLVQVTCIGTVLLTLLDEKQKPFEMLLDNVMYSPHFSCNLLSIEQLYSQHKIATVFKGNRAQLILPNGTSIPFGTDERRRYMLHANMAEASMATPADIAQLWHRRLCHAGSAAMKRMVSVIPSLSAASCDFSDCDPCLQGGGRKIPLNGPARRRAQPDASFRKPRVHVRYTYFGQRLSADLCGPMPLGYGKEQYMLIIHDSSTSMIFVYNIKEKTASAVMEAFRLFMSDYSDKLTRGIGQLHTDNGGEFLNEDMEAFCEEIGTKRTYTVPYLSSQNPYAERANQTVLRPLRTILAESGIGERWWPMLAQHIALVHNTLVNDQSTSPYERLHEVKFDYSKLHVPGCLCYYLVPERDRPSKLSPRAVHAIYLGLDPSRNGHRVWVPSMQRYTTSFHIIFNEHRFYDSTLDKARVSFEDSTSQRDTSEHIGERIRRSRRVPSEGYREERDQDVTERTAASGSDRWTDIPGLPEMDPTSPDYSPAMDPAHGSLEQWSDDHCSNSKCMLPKGHDGPCSDQDVGDKPRRRTQASRFTYTACECEGCIYHHDHCGPCIDDDRNLLQDPLSIMTADLTDEYPYYTRSVIFDDVTNETLDICAADLGNIPCPDQYEDVQSPKFAPVKPRWTESMRGEHEALIKNETWEYISRNDPKVRGRKPTKSRWVYTIKYNRDGTINRFKSRFVVCGYSQRQGIDYDRAFSSTLRSTSFRTLLAIAAGKKMRLMQFDVSNAFTQALLDDVDLYVEPPKGFEEWELVNGKRVSKLLHLKRALYGTKQASRLWQNTLKEFLESQGFIASKADPCLYRKASSNGEIILGVYVDDVLCAYRGNEMFEEFKDAFFKRFPGKCDKLQWFLGMAIDQHEDYSIHVDHELSISKMAEKYIPNNQVTRECPPADLFNKLDRATTDIERVKVEPFGYSSIVGAILYIAVMSRPDIAFHASILAKFLADPSEECCNAATQLLQYLACTSKRKMYFSGQTTIPEGLEKHRADIERNCGFVAYSDSSWGNKYPYPMFGYGIYLYGSLISYASKQLKTVAFSSCEAEYAAGSFACKEIEFVRYICADMGVVLNGRLVLAVDNTACMDIAFDVGVSGRTKHYDRAIHYMRDLTQYKRVLPVYVRTELQRADGYTKGLDKHKYYAWIKHILHN